MTTIDTVPRTCPDHINPLYWDEWVHGSGVHPELVLKNVRSLTDDQAYEYLLYSSDLDRRNDGRVSDWVLRRYRHTESGGWWVSGVDLVALKTAIKKHQIQPGQTDENFPCEWGQFKPLQPYRGRDNKAVKYEAPPRVDTRVVAPLGFNPRLWMEALTNASTPIVICEGAKKAACLISLGYVAIALPGVFNGHRKDPQRLIEDLQVICAPGRPVYICFDHDLKEKTRRNVTLAISQLGRLFKLNRCQVRVIDLPGPEKGADDFVVSRGKEAFDYLFQNAPLLHQWEVQGYRLLTWKPDLELNQKYLGSLEIPQSARLVCIKSPKGTGKTEALIRIVADAMDRGQRVLLLTHRVQLGQAICDRVGLNYVTELRTAGEGALFGYGLCIDSLHPESQARFNAAEWEDALVIVDECEQVFWHLLSASTEVRKHRLTIVNQLQQVFQQSLESETGRIILLDADLTDISIRFVRKLSEIRVKPWVVVNHWHDLNSRVCWHYADTKPKSWYAALNDAVATGEKVYVALQSQRVRSTWSAINIEKDLLKRYPHLKILRVDSETISDPSHPACGCVSKMDQLLQSEKYDVVIATPAIETGVSIDIRGYFDSVWGCFWGVSSADSARQALARVRDDCPRHVWAASRGVQSVASGDTSKYRLLKSQNRITRAAISCLRLGGWNLENEEYSTNDAALNAWGEIACRINSDINGYRDAVISGLRREGYDVQSADLCPNPELVESLIETRDEEYDRECQEMEQIELVCDSKGEELEKKKARTKDDRLKLNKWKLHKKYAGMPITTDLIKRDDDGLYPQLQLFYYLTVGREFLSNRDKQSLAGASQNGQVWLPTFTKSEMSTKILLLEHLKIQKLMNPEWFYTNDQEDMQWLKEEALRFKRDIKECLGFTVGEKDSPISIANKLLDKIGGKLTYLDRRGSRGQPRPRTYCYFPPEDDREEILQRWLEQDIQKRNESAVSSELNNINAA